jgi:hypothetical protein
MFWLITSLLVVPFLGMIAYSFRPKPKDHQACLRRIWKLEMELLPDLPPELYWAVPKTKWYKGYRGLRSPSSVTWGEFEKKYYGDEDSYQFGNFVSWPN